MSGSSSRQRTRRGACSSGTAGPRTTGAVPVSERYDDGRWVFEGETSDVSGKIKAIPDLPTIVIAEKTAVLRLGADPAPPASARADRERWNDYGIGLLLQRDDRAAAAA